MGNTAQLQVATQQQNEDEFRQGCLTVKYFMTLSCKTTSLAYFQSTSSGTLRVDASTPRKQVTCLIFSLPVGATLLCENSRMKGSRTKGGHTLSQQEDVVCKLVGLRLGLQQGHEDGCLLHVHEVAQALHNEVGCGAVKPCRDLVQEQRVLGSHHHLACIEAHLRE